MLSSSWTKDAPWLTYLNLFTPTGAGSQTKRRHPRLSCAAATTSLQFIPLSCISLSRFRLQVFLGLLSCDVRLASGTEIVLVYMFYPFATYGLTISIFFSLAVLMWVLVQSFSKVHHCLSVLANWYSVSCTKICVWKLVLWGTDGRLPLIGDFRSLILE